MAEKKNKPERNTDVTLISKILKAVKHVQSLDITKDGTNDYSHYDYVSEVQVSQLGHSLANHGVIFLPQIAPVSHWTETNKKGSIKNYVMVQGHFKLTDGKESITGSMPGIGTDATDKAIYKAETGAKKNFLMQFFLLASKDDPDNQKKNGNYSGKKNYKNNDPQARIKAMERKPISNKQIKFVRSLAKQVDSTKLNEVQAQSYNWAVQDDFTKANAYMGSYAINQLSKAPKKSKVASK